jgi:hypothetical protein
VQQDSGEGFWQVSSFPKENCIKLKTLSIASLDGFVHSSDGILNETCGTHMIIHFMFMCLVTTPSCTPFDYTVFLSSASSDKLCMVCADSAGLFLPAAVVAFCHCYTI